MKMKYVVFLLAVALMVAGLPMYASDTDDRIEASAKATYVFKTYLADDDIKVKSKDGHVTLSGTVLYESHLSLAEETVGNLPGVKSVDNKLDVKGGRPAENSDAWIQMKVKTSLLFHRNVSGTGTEVDVKDGVVTLRGEADDKAQKQLTGEYAKDIVGVRDVKNEMTVAKAPKAKQTMGEKIDDASITTQVKFALLTHTSTHVMSTKVETQNGVVTLYGKATSGAEKDLVSKLVGDIKGVVEVRNKIVVEPSK
ncbi:MAG TPA: transport-associated protein [Syntrophus sp. (in: bacteria)]|jgi:hyperosmotically inducible protein|nr:transport-associated protein [Syntrophus sp. (in: bacteria)]